MKKNSKIIGENVVMQHVCYKSLADVFFPFFRSLPQRYTNVWSNLPAEFVYFSCHIVFQSSSVDIFLLCEETVNLDVTCAVLSH